MHGGIIPKGENMNKKTKNKNKTKKKTIHITTKKKTVMPKTDHLYGRLAPRPLRNAAKDNVKSEIFYT